MERIDRMTEAPVPGKFYLVPVVTARWYHLMGEWPVIGPKHQDFDFFNFDEAHYHIDARFLTAKQRKHAKEGPMWRYGIAENVQAAPLGAHHQHDDKLPTPKFKRRKCWTEDVGYVYGDKPQIQNLRKHFAGAQCPEGSAGWICPHRKAPLGSVAVIDGVITCPLHGLRIDAATGKCLSTESVMGRER